MSRRRHATDDNIYRAAPFSDEELAAPVERKSPAEKASRVAGDVDRALELCRIVQATVIGPGRRRGRAR